MCRRSSVVTPSQSRMPTLEALEEPVPTTSPAPFARGCRTRSSLANPSTGAAPWFVDLTRRRRGHRSERARDLGRSDRGLEHARRRPDPHLHPARGVRLSAQAARRFSRRRCGARLRQHDERAAVAIWPSRRSSAWRPAGLIAAWLALLGVDFALLWGFVAFGLNFIPNLGSILAAIPDDAAGHAAARLLLRPAGCRRLPRRQHGPRQPSSSLCCSAVASASRRSSFCCRWSSGAGSGAPSACCLSVPLTMVVKLMLENTQEFQWVAVMLGDEASALRQRAETGRPQGCPKPPQLVPFRSSIALSRRVGGALAASPSEPGRSGSSHVCTSTDRPRKRRALRNRPLPDDSPDQADRLRDRAHVADRRQRRRAPHGV